MKSLMVPAILACSGNVFEDVSNENQGPQTGHAVRSPDQEAHRDGVCSRSQMRESVSVDMVDESSTPAHSSDYRALTTKELWREDMAS
jgi:hypothetical protein